MVETRSVLAVLTLLSCAACAGPESPSAPVPRWTAAELIGVGVRPVMVGGAGDAMVAWRNGLPPWTLLATKRFAPPEGWSQQGTLGAGVRTLDLATGPNDRVIAWAFGANPGGPSEVMVSRIAPSGATSGTRLISTAESDPMFFLGGAPPAVHVGSGGRAAVAWLQATSGGHRIWVSSAAAGEGFPVATLAAEVEGLAERVVVAVDARGATTVVWRRYVPGENRILSCHLPPGQTSCQVETIHAFPVAFPGFDPPSLAAMPTGEVQAIWTAGLLRSGERGEVWSSRLRAGLWDAPTEIGPDRAAAPGETPAERPRVVSLTGGVVLAVWEQYDTAVSGFDIWSARSIGASGWEPARKLESSPDPAYALGVAAGPRGGAMVAWFHLGERSPEPRLVTRRLDDAGRWEEPLEVPRQAGGFLPEHPPQLAFDSAGGTLIVWGEDPGVDDRATIWSSRLDPGAP